jgi:Family of unknown function (DUF5686)/CarboxypepD_reg-like domain
MHRNLVLLIFLVSGMTATGQSFRLHGKITNSKLEPLAFASVQVKEWQSGTTTKDNGSYELYLDEGVYSIVVSMIGYKTQLIKISLRNKDQVQNVILEEGDAGNLSEVIIRGKSRDRSEEIIRQVIKHKENIAAAAGPYSCDVYIRASQEDSTSRAKKKNKADTALRLPDELALQRMAMAEISLRYDHESTQRTKEERTGISVRGNADGLFYLTTTKGDFSFYNNLISVPSISVTPFLSPVSYSGLIAYRFKMISIEQRGSQKIYTISVRPGKLSNATVEGEIVIADSSWNILHTRFSFPRFHLPEYDFFEVEQQYEPVHDTAWMITRQQFTYFSKNNKGKKSGSTVVTYRDFELNKTFPKKYFGTELSSASAEAYGRDSSFWEQVRNEPLTEKEVRFVHYKDSIHNARNTTAYLDSIDRLTNKVTWKKIAFFGQQIYSREKERLWNLPALYTLYQPITFGGTRLMAMTSLIKGYKSKKNFALFANISYGFRNKDVNGSVRFNKLYDPFRRRSYTLSVSRDFQYIFQGDAWINLIKRSNVYLNNSIGVGHSTELINGLFLNMDFNLAFRRSVGDYKTNPLVDSLLGDLLDDNHAVSFDSYNAAYGQVELRYTPWQRYIREPREKVILGSSWPTFYVLWKKGLPGILHSKVDFDYLEFGIQQSLKLGLTGISSYTVKTGNFPSRGDLRLVDYKFQRRGDPVLFLNPNEAFQSLDSTFPVFKRYYEAHYVHEFNGAILNKIPLLKKLGLREMVGGGFLFAPERNLRYAEILMGVERVFKAPFNINSKFKLGVYVVGSAANQFSNPVQFKVGITTWDKQRGKWF